ncbi:MAG: hypothetical protein JWM18_223 [Chloroflexi bacterium]|nr:hypothetical protein [Chloroflexota bacterium]
MPPMLGRARFLKRLLLDLPRNLKLAYCLWLDPRVPVRNKAAMGAALGLIVTPYINLPAWIPVVGEMDIIALSLLASRLFIGAAPDAVVAEHEAAIRRHESRFDRDVEAGRRVAVALSRRLPIERRRAEAETDAGGPGLPASAAGDPAFSHRRWSWETDTTSSPPADQRTSGVTR